MRKFRLHFFIFFLCFQLEVRVKAGLIEVPEACAKKSGHCVLKAVRSPWHSKFGEKLILHATPLSVIERQDKTHWNFIKGELWVEKANDVSFDSVYGSIRAVHGQFWLISEGDKIWVRNISADLSVTLRDGKKITAPEGFQFWISGLNSKAETNYGMIEPIDMKNHLPLWQGLFTGSKEEFLEQVKNYRANWGNLAERSGDIYKAVVLREIASDDKKRQEEAQRKQRAQAERQRVREMFRARVFDR